MSESVAKIFIGSSTEARPFAEALQQLLIELGERKFSTFEANGWWDEELFPVGSTTIESLYQALNTHDAALFLAAPDDIVIVREVLGKTMRNNVLFEYGLFLGRHGARRVSLAVLEKLEKPVDLLGVTDLRLWVSPLGKAETNLSGFKQKNRGLVDSWLNQLKGDGQHNSKDDLLEILPKLNASILSVFKSFKDASPWHKGQIDFIASDIFAAVAAAFDNKGIDAQLTKQIKTILKTCQSISAIDVLGPSGWVNPSTYRYLAHQIKAYIRRNTAQENEWHLRVDDDLWNALRRASDNARRLTLPAGRPSESLTLFDNPKDFSLHRGAPLLQFARVLLWSEAELRTQVGEAVISIHDAFNVPLFFVPTLPNDPKRDIDYIFFTEAEEVIGFYGFRGENYQTLDINDGRIPGLPSAVKDHFFKILQDTNLLFAADARHALMLGGDLLLDKNVQD